MSKKANKFLFDTDVLVDFFHDEKYAKGLIERLITQGFLWTSILSIAELRAGFNAEQARFFLPRLYNLINIVNLSREIAELGGAFRQEYAYKGVSLSVVDTLIAATAVSGNYCLVTRNKKDFPMTEVKLYQFPLEGVSEAK